MNVTEVKLIKSTKMSQQRSHISLPGSEEIIRESFHIQSRNFVEMKTEDKIALPGSSQSLLQAFLKPLWRAKSVRYLVLLALSCVLLDMMISYTRIAGACHEGRAHFCDLGFTMGRMQISNNENHVA
uniref:Uncharacterized protein n=1 Tax=Glossina austeni TaxID=7395 RepID=A0A1A9UVZ1_GLOAU